MRIYKLLLKISIINLLFVFICSFNAIASDGDTAVVFRQISLEQAIKDAKAENKKGVFVHCFAEWCHYCQYMRDSVYTDKDVADLVNPNFVCIKMDLEKEGKTLNETLKIHTYPGLVFYDTNGEIMHRAAGRKYKQPFIDLIKDAMNPEKQMRTIAKKYESGAASPKETYGYFRMLETSGMDAQPFINDYLSKVPDSTFLAYDSWRIIYDIIKDPTMAAMDRILNKRKDLGAIYTDDSVTNKLIILHNYYLGLFIQQLDSVGFEKAKANILANKKLADLSQKICAYGDLNKYKLKSEYDTYRIEGPKFIEKYAVNDPRRINDVCGTLYERFSGDTVLMTRCMKWLESSVKAIDIYKGNHVLASVYTVLGKCDLAKKTAEHALDLAKKQGVADYKMTQILLDRLKQICDEKTNK